MFSQQDASRLAVLESKLKIYEELTKDMLERLEKAVEKISEGNNRIANILAKHDERIDQSVKTDQLIIRMIEDLKEKHKEESEKIIERIEDLETDVVDVGRIKWMTIGCGIVLAILATSISTLASGMWTPNGLHSLKENQEQLLNK